MKANTASKSKEWPKTIRHGNASVKLYKVKSGDYTLYTLAWRGADGKRKLRQFADEKEAKEEADAAARRLHEGELTQEMPEATTAASVVWPEMQIQN